RIDNPGHPGRVGVYCSEYDENRKNSGTDTSVNAEGVRENRGKWSDTASSFVSLGSNGRDSYREVQGSDYDYGEGNASVEISLWVVALVRYVGHVLIGEV